ncbi:beta strand repeat-containing protein [Roseateles albus]|uniref:PEP-CTERM sorting domain-containing protein n=1 Tax=Roseateles albus TaxID=2987525 RepID=A0ABT5KBB6_9BURK|nr:PEP-CTERM sorting domain-containing protein [Roseateles albus]MDC8770280.1 PEP-CTERM sorting domain-containing protein [Roseateles albus]
MKPTLTRLALALLPLFGAASVSAATVPWIGPNGGSWSNAANWGGPFPGVLDDVQLGSFNTHVIGNIVVGSATGTGTVLINTSNGSGLNLRGNSSLGGLTLEEGFFNSNATTSISGSLTWRNGSLLGPGTTHVEGSASLSLANGLLLTGGHTLVLKGSTSAQTLGFSSQNALTIENARLVNEGTWLDEATDNSSFKNLNPQLGLGNFDNAGSFTKSSATVTTFQSGVLFNNSGTVNVNVGTLRILGGGSSTGSFNVAEGATLAFGNLTTYNLGAAVINAGTVTIAGNVNAAQGLQLGGNAAVNAGELRLGAASSFVNLSLNGSGAISSSSTLLVTGNLDLTGGFLNGSGTTRSTGELRISGDDTMGVGPTHLLLAAGSTQRTGPGALNISGRVQNLGTWSEQATSNTLITGNGRFENPGIFNKDSAFITSIGGGVLVFDNSGTVNVNAGTLRLVSNFNNQGLINIASGSELHVNHSVLNRFVNAGTLAGSGTVRAVDTTNTGILAPGGVGQVGQLQVLGNLATSGSLQVDLSRSSADLLAVSGNADLGGTLNFSVLSGQRLARGSSFTVMSWGNRSAASEFANLDFSQASGYRLTTDYGATGLSVKVTGLPYTWTGAAAGGVWDVVNNWNEGSDGLPQAGDAVLLGSADTRIRTTLAAATVTGTGRLILEGGAHLILSDSGSLGAASLLQGRLTNNGRLVVTGPSTWISTELRGTGVTRLEGATAISGTDFDGTSSVLGGHTLELAGNTTFTGRRGMSVGDGGTVINQGSWVDQATSNVTLGNFNGGTGRFLNQGSFTKVSNTRTLIGETSLDIENTGSINVNAGYLRLSGSRVNSTGTLNIAAGAELSLVSNDATLGGSVLNEGSLSLDGGVLAIAGDLLVQGSGLTRVKSIVNNDNALRIAGSVDWHESTLRGSGSTRMDGTVMLVGDRSRGVLGGQTVELTGTTRQVGTGGFSIGQGAVLRNLGTWLDEAPGNVGLGNFNGGATGRFDNVGTFTKTSAFVTEIGNGLPLNNTGTLNIKAGTLRISGDASLTAGQIQIASGAMLDLASGSIALKGTVQNAGTVALNGATVLVTDSATVQGGLTTLNSSTVNNTGRLVLSGNTDWIIATLTGSGNTRMEGALTLSGSNGRGLTGGQTLELAGSTTQTGTGSLNTGGGARVLNLGNWVEAANGNAHLGNFAGGALSRFDNVGSFTKTSAFVTDIGNGLVLNNTGTIDIQAGTLRISQAFNNQGQLNVAAGAELASTVVDFANAGTLAGDGTLRTVGSFFSLSNTGILAAGGLNDAGTLSLLGGLTQQAGGIFLVDLGSTAVGGFDLLTISGAASLTGTLAVNLLDGAHFKVGDSFTVMTWNQRLGDSQFASLDLRQAGGYSFATEYGASSLTLRVMTAPVPEPETWALMALGLGLLAWRRSAARHAA